MQTITVVLHLLLVLSSPNLDGASNKNLCTWHADAESADAEEG